MTLGLHQLCDDPRSVRRLLDLHGLECDDLSALRITRDEDATMAAASEYRVAVQELNPKGVTTLYWTTVKEESVDRVGRIADYLQTPLLIEFSPGPVATLADAEAVITSVGSDRARIILDSYHFFRSGSTWQMLDSVPLSYIEIVQFNDALPAISSNYMDETTKRRTWPGSGEFELERFSETLRNKGWDRPVSIEVMSEHLAQLSLEAYCRLAYESSISYWT